MTFEDWFQQQLDLQPGQSMRSHVLAQRSMAEDAWDAAMEEAGRRCRELSGAAKTLPAWSIRQAMELDIYCRAAADCADYVLHGAISGATPAPRQEAPEAGSCAPGEPAPEPRRGPE
jgi:hypothetical protein